LKSSAVAVLVAVARLLQAVHDLGAAVEVVQSARFGSFALLT
jgi:hypothetical protein